MKLSRSKFGNWPRGASSRLHPSFTVNDMMFGGGPSIYQIPYALRFRVLPSGRAVQLLSLRHSARKPQ